jgi:hypothetical protein
MIPPATPAGVNLKTASFREDKDKPASGFVTIGFTRDKPGEKLSGPFNPEADSTGLQLTGVASALLGSPSVVDATSSNSSGNDQGN